MNTKSDTLAERLLNMAHGYLDPDRSAYREAADRIESLERQLSESAKNYTHPENVHRNPENLCIEVPPLPEPALTKWYGASSESYEEPMFDIDQMREYGQACAISVQAAVANQTQSNGAAKATGTEEGLGAIDCREEFEQHFGGTFEYDTIADGWGRKKYRHPHVESIYYGFQSGRASIAATRGQAQEVVIRLTAKQAEKLSDSLEDYQDCGPCGEGWASAELHELREIAYSATQTHEAQQEKK